MKLINKHISLSLIILLVFATIITACHQDIAEPDVEVGEVRRVVTAQEIPSVTKALVNQMGLNNGDQRFSVNNGQSQDLLNIDWDEILQLVDSTGNETYTFRIEDNDYNPFVFYNLVIRFNAFGDPFSPFLVKYEMSEDFIPQYLETGSMSNFSGKISKIVISPSNSDYNRGSVNAGPQAPRMINENPDCPPEDIYMDNGTTGGGGGPGGGPGGGGTGGGGGSYRVCESYTQDILWISSVCDSEGNDCSVSHVEVLYTIIREYCFTVNANEASGGPDCNTGYGGLPILEPDIYSGLNSLIECDSTALLFGINGNQEKYKAWEDLAKHSSSSSIKSKLNSIGGFELSLKNARGPVVNMDDFSVKVNSLPTGMSAMQLFQAFRTDINSFLDTNVSYFAPYSAEDANTWQSHNPLGSMFSIQFFDPIFQSINIDDGTVITSDYNGGTWIFTTVWTPNDGQHPVSGNREFGFSHNSDGSYTFFTRGVDRITTQLNATAQYLTGAVFNGGDKLWKSFQSKLASYVNSNGGSAKVVEPTINRVDWDMVRHILTLVEELPPCEKEED